MNSDWLNDVLSNISSDLSLELNKSEISEQDLLDAIASRVADLMDRDAGLLFSYLYRLDISEESLKEVINTAGDKPIAYRIAELILSRQKTRIEFKKKYKSEFDSDDWEWDF
jgi:hypothetical protein